METGMALHLPSSRKVLSPVGVESSDGPEPGERCPTCNRRKAKPRTADSPTELKRWDALGPSERVEAVREGLDYLQEYVGIDPHSYPHLTLLEGLMALGAQQREELRRHFDRRSEAI